MKTKFLFSFLCVSAFSYAQTEEQAQITERMNDQRAQAEIKYQAPNQTVQAQTQPKAEAGKSINISKEELVKHPDLVVRAMIPAVMQNNTENVELLFPIYQQIPAEYQDPVLIQWAQAILAKKDGNYTTSIAHYRQILSAHSEATMVRLQLAIALFENNELEAAEDQFQKVRSEQISEQLKEITDQYIIAISQKDRWTFSGGLTYLNDPNINNAPKDGTTYGNWFAPKSESAQGSGFNLNIGKKWSWGGGFYNELRLNGSSKYYWNNKKYNEATGRSSFGIGFQNAKFNVVMLPFMEQTWYAGGSSGSKSLKRYSKAFGATLETSYWLSPQWQLDNVYEYAEQRYMDRKHLNGNYHFVSSGLTYLISAKQYWFGNVNYQRSATRDKDDSYYRKGISLGWGQEWGKGLSTRLSVSFAQKNYKAPMPIFGIQQRNKEYGVQASIWHRAIHFWGITPRLTYNYTKVKSNHVFYTYDKQRVFVDFSKRF